MKYSYTWLQKHINESLPSPEVLKEKIIFHAFEVESVETYGNDTVFDIKVLPDRAHDCLSHYGMAREIAGLLELSLKSYTKEVLPEVPLTTKIEIQSSSCRRYIAIKIDGVTVGASPSWLREALESVGARSINNIVDATNYVLFDRGQPVHAFDTEKVDGGIVVRFAHEGETITTLSKEEKILQESDTVIADYLGALAIAGVKGGATAEVNDATKSILVEIANFSPAPIRKTSRKLGLVTDASKRFENDLSPSVAYEAAVAVALLIQKIAGGSVVGVSDMYQPQEKKNSISFTPKEISNLLGTNIEATVVENVFNRYGYHYVREGDTFVLTVPDERGDIAGVHDIAEEIGRVVGYDTIIPASLPFTPVVHPSEFDKIRAVKYWLSKNGFREVITYAFRKKGDIYVVRGPKDRSALRTDLSQALQESYQLNRTNAPLLGLQNIRLFEVGTVFLSEKEEVRVATVDNGVFEEAPIDSFIQKYAISLSVPEESVLVSGVFSPWSIYPFITRDIAVWVATPEDGMVLDTIISQFAKEYCVREPFIFDRFEKEGKTSIAYRLVFQSFEKTLTEAFVEDIFQKLLKEIKEKNIFTIR